VGLQVLGQRAGLLVGAGGLAHPKQVVGQARE
jgi:hypothetical protein